MNMRRRRGADGVVPDAVEINGFLDKTTGDYYMEMGFRRGDERWSFVLSENAYHAMREGMPPSPRQEEMGEPRTLHVDWEGYDAARRTLRRACRLQMVRRVPLVDARPHGDVPRMRRGLLPHEVRKVRSGMGAPCEVARGVPGMQVALLVLGDGRRIAPEGDRVGARI